MNAFTNKIKLSFPSDFPDDHETYGVPWTPPKK